MKAEKGFTLIELLVVFALLALVAGVVPPAFDKLKDSAQYRDTVRSFFRDLRVARNLALTQGQETRFVVDLKQRTYGIDGFPPKPLPASLDVRATLAGIESFPGEPAAVRFLPAGGASGGSFEILRANGAGTRLRVDWLSGRVSQEGLLQ